MSQGAPGNIMIYVGDLPVETTEADLYETFKEYGNIIHIRIAKSYMRPDVKYAIVNFTTPEEALRARRECVATRIYGHPIRVMLFTKEKAPEANIFIKNLDEKVDSKDLEELFAKYGSIISSKICYDENGRSRGYGFIQFDKPESARKAIQEKNGGEFRGKTLEVNKFIPAMQRYDLSQNKNLYVRGFGSEYNNEQLLKKFSEFGSIVSATTMSNNSQGGVSRYFGFVAYEDAASAERAIKALDGKTEGNMTWYVKPHENKRIRRLRLIEEYKRRVENWKYTNLVLKGLPKTIDESKLVDMCSRYGRITSVKILKVENLKYDADGNRSIWEIPTGTAFVCFSDPAEKNKAKNELRTINIEGSKIQVNNWRPRAEIIAYNIKKKQQQNQIFMFQQRAMYQKPLPRGGNFRGNFRGGFQGPAPMGRMPPQMMPPHLNNRPMQMMQPSSGRGREHPQVPRGAPQYQPKPAPVPQPRLPQPATVPAPAQPQPVPKAVAPNVLPAFDHETYSRADPQTKKRLIGEHMYPIILGFSNQFVAGKITGMLLEMENELLFKFIANPSQLKERVIEAIEVLRKAWSNQPDLLKQLPNY